MSALIRFGVSGGVDAVVVHDILFGLQVPFSWCIDNSPRILQHWDEIGQDDRFGEEVLTSTEQWRPLPLPLTFLRIVVAAMRGPDYQMTVIESVGDAKRTRHIADPGLAVVANLSPKRVAGERGIVCGIVLKRQSRDDDAKIIVAVDLREQFVHLLVDFADLLIVELLLGEGGIRHDGDLPLLIVDAQLFESGLTGKVGIFCLVRDKVSVQILLGLFLIGSILCEGLRTRKKQQS